MAPMSIAKMKKCRVLVSTVFGWDFSAVSYIKSSLTFGLSRGPAGKTHARNPSKDSWKIPKTKKAFQEWIKNMLKLTKRPTILRKFERKHAKN